MISSVLRDKILEFVQKRISISDLEEWLVPQIPVLIADPDSAESDLVATIELGIAELEAGIRSSEDLIRFFEQVLSENNVISVNLSKTVAGSSNVASPIGSYFSETQYAVATP